MRNDDHVARGAGRRRRARVAAGLVALAVCAAVGCGSPDEEAITTASEGEVDVDGPRWGPAVAWTGREVFVFGGSSVGPEGGTGSLNDGLLVAPDLSTATPLPASPFEHPLAPATAAASDGRVYVAGIMCADARTLRELDDPPCGPGTFAMASFDPDTASWRRFDGPPADVDGRTGVRVLGATDDGRVVVAVSTASDPAQIWVYSPEGEEWETAGALGGGSAVVARDACLAGAHVVVPGSADRPGSLQPVGDGVVAHVLDLRDEPLVWSTTEPIAHTFAQPAVVSCHPSGALVTAGGSPHWGSWHLDVPSLSWHPARAAPAAHDRNGVPSVYAVREWIGTELYFVSADPSEPGLSYDPSRDRWRERPPSPANPSELVWTGELLVGSSGGPSPDAPGGSLVSFSPS